jgi:aspartyl-tRNA(Asn)/glutamyl-tRNA(Gln) amidotransferase subunit C
MPSELTRADVEAVAALAHLELTDEETRVFVRQLAEILAYADDLQAVDTTGVPATAHVSAELRTERADEPGPSLAVDDALANAPDKAPGGGFFRVPRVLA